MTNYNGSMTGRFTKQIRIKPGGCKQIIIEQETIMRIQERPCKRKAIKDGYCNVHHPETIKRKQQEKDAKYEAERAARKLKGHAEYFYGALIRISNRDCGDPVEYAKIIIHEFKSK